MSELKAYIAPTADGTGLAEYYLKSEADRMIEELKEKLDLYKRGWAENDKVNAHLYAELRHQKYKRCLAMARWCEAEGCWYENQGEDIKASWFFKWEHKWLELPRSYDL